MKFEKILYNYLQILDFIMSVRYNMRYRDYFI